MMAQRMTSANMGKEVPSGDRFQCQFKKTIFCKFFAEHKCKNGNSCNFAHNLAEFRTAPDLAKTSLCKMYKSGACNKDGASCQFAHGVCELRLTPMFRKRKDEPTDSDCNGPSMLANTHFKPPFDAPGSNMTRGSHREELRQAPFKPSVDLTKSSIGVHASWWGEPHKASNMMLLAPPPRNDAKLCPGLDFAQVSGSWSGDSSESESIEPATPPRLRAKVVGVQVEPGIRMLFQGTALPESMEALESLLKNAMPDQYED